jgi:CRP-like cAMP-binding protein/predicted GNAT family N-acyltransferase
MSIRLIIARTAKELDDVFKLRYEVYVLDKGRFSSDSTSNESQDRLVDQFDTIPDTANIIAYDNDIPVACMRVNKDSEIGLPSEMHFDFSAAREQITLECEQKNITPVIVCAGMLAIKKGSRNRRNIIHAMFKTSASIMHSFSATHVIASISEETLSLYGRIGFEVQGESRWCDSIADTLIPMLAPFEKAFKWSFGDIYSRNNSIWLDGIQHDFERRIFSTGEVLFYQGMDAENAYVIEEGWVSISRIDNEDNEMVISNLTKGELFGEMSLFDQQPRSATVTALTNVEVNMIPRKQLLAMIKENPQQMGQLLSSFSQRLRDMGDQTMMHIFAPQTARIQFELQKLWHSAAADKNISDARMAKIGPQQVALSAHVLQEDVLTILEQEKNAGKLEYNNKTIRFLTEPMIDE